MDGNDMGKCPVMHGSNTASGKSATSWWPNALNLDILHQQDQKTNPYCDDFNYAEAAHELAEAIAQLRLIQKLRK